MTPQDKAKELVEKLAAYSYYSSGGSVEVMAGNQLYSAKQCALIAVGELIDLADRVSDISGNYFTLTGTLYYGDAEKELHYWQQVKQEIEKL